MRGYLNLLKFVANNGVLIDGKSVVRQKGIEFDLSEQFPLMTVTTVDKDRAAKELLWFISGDLEIGPMKGDPYWDSIAVTKQHIDDFIKARPDLTEEQIKHNVQAKLNSVNASESFCWRNIPTANINYYWPDTPIDKMPSDKIKSFKEAYSEFNEADKQSISEEAFLQMCYKHSIDQLNNLVNGLKDRLPNVDIAVLSAGVSNEPYKSLSVQENIIMDKVSAVSLIKMFDCTIVKTKSVTQKDLLDMRVYVNSADAFREIPYAACQYGLLLSLLAKVSDLNPGKLTLHMTDLYVERDSLQEINKTIATSPKEPMILNISNVTDIFDLKVSDIEFTR